MKRNSVTEGRMTAKDMKKKRLLVAPPPSKITLQPIGYVRTSASESDLKKRKRFVRSAIILNKRFSQGLKGIEDYSYIFVIFWLHKVKRSSREELLLHPRHREDLPEVGIFATRQSNHPNPIGLTVVKLLGHGSDLRTLKVEGLDARSGTPVLDIKPYDFQDVRRREGIRVPEWWLKLHTNRN
ncbi:MAG: tRNA (N6-threonylcarbamoyladenosine(37)-N6)-methyltransferase TrmO [Nitrososphaerota archaeon]|nr:tRNA (N6-threonylcarbamoyladenosine(37)-N6)-methyltransferase TrmO [Nitrososphaerota archaeon]